MLPSYFTTGGGAIQLGRAAHLGCLVYTARNLNFRARLHLCIKCEQAYGEDVKTKHHAYIYVCVIRSSKLTCLLVGIYSSTPNACADSCSRRDTTLACSTYFIFHRHAWEGVVELLYRYLVYRPWKRTSTTTSVQKGWKGGQRGWKGGQRDSLKCNSVHVHCHHTGGRENPGYFKFRSDLQFVICLFIRFCRDTLKNLRYLSTKCDQIVDHCYILFGR